MTPVRVLAASAAVALLALTGGGIGAVGIALTPADADSNLDPVMDNNKVVRNDVSGFATAIDDGGTATKAQANVITP